MKLFFKPLLAAMGIVAIYSVNSPESLARGGSSGSRGGSSAAAASRSAVSSMVMGSTSGSNSDSDGGGHLDPFDLRDRFGVPLIQSAFLRAIAIYKQHPEITEAQKRIFNEKWNFLPFSVAPNAPEECKKFNWYALRMTHVLDVSDYAIRPGVRDYAIASTRSTDGANAESVYYAIWSLNSAQGRSARRPELSGIETEFTLCTGFAVSHQASALLRLPFIEDNKIYKDNGWIWTNYVPGEMAQTRPYEIPEFRP